MFHWHILALSSKAPVESYNVVNRDELQCMYARGGDVERITLLRLLSFLVRLQVPDLVHRKPLQQILQLHILPLVHMLISGPCLESFGCNTLSS